MEADWASCKNILVVRADNLGDVIMSSPAIRALKESFGAKITLLTSSAGAAAAKLINEIDEVIVYDFPWVKHNEMSLPNDYIGLLKRLKDLNFDGAIIFTVYSQSALPAAIMLYLSQIPLRAAYCRENPYHLLTDWLPDEEPFNKIQHQVKRDLNLTAFIGAKSKDSILKLKVIDCGHTINHKLNIIGIKTGQPFLILHAGVSEKKRQYPVDSWICLARKIFKETNLQIVFTGNLHEKNLTDYLQLAVGKGSCSAGGVFNLEEFTYLISQSKLIISVNTGAIHLAAAVKTPLIVLYALTNPQHYPWQAYGKVLPFSIDQNLESKNEVIKFVNKRYFQEHINLPSPDQIVEEVNNILKGHIKPIKELPFPY